MVCLLVGWLTNGFLLFLFGARERRLAAVQAGTHLAAGAKINTEYDKFTLVNSYYLQTRSEISYA